MVGAKNAPGPATSIVAWLALTRSGGFGYGMPVWGRLVGTPRFGVGTSEYGRDYRLGYGLTGAEGGAMSFELGIDAARRESPAQGGAEHGVQDRLTARW